ncbi:hypothetical protein JOC34_000429 [Virgibacillus halotolerans]|uniref:hypothetical protein n=1 Tax=Virgibacillus halotolerans TaxID=1071053 RepID=UPI00196080AB|nr:hypothetical protein [Virgibacillus halotolerans]MBM7598072.1 hypothetical protein [Virgibacillus halotolerans]
MSINSQTTSQSHVDYSVYRFSARSINKSNSHVEHTVDKSDGIYSTNISKSSMRYHLEIKRSVTSNTKSNTIEKSHRVIYNKVGTQTKSDSHTSYIVRKEESVTSKNKSISATDVNVLAIVHNSYDIIKLALDYNLGDMKSIPTTVDTYIHDKFIFKFPLFNKHSLTIYIYDDRYDFNKDFHNATIKVYEDGKWIHENIWVDKIEQYLFDLHIEIETNRERLENERKLEEYNRQREENEKLIRFAILLGAATSKGIILPYWIDADKSYDEDYAFDEDSTLADFMNYMFDADVIDVNIDE